MMRCIIVDDEPLAREAILMLCGNDSGLQVLGAFGSAVLAADFLANNAVDLVFLDIQMPGINGIDFARTIPRETLVVFTTAFSEFATDSYEVDALDYLIKPVRVERFQKAVDKARAYHKLLRADHTGNAIAHSEGDFFFVKAERKIFKVGFKDIRFIEGLKDYVVMHTEGQKVITAMNIKTIHEQLPRHLFARVSKSYIINVAHIDSVDNNTVYIGKDEIPIGNIYRDAFFDEFVNGRILSR